MKRVIVLFSAGCLLGVLADLFRRHAEVVTLWLGWLLVTFALGWLFLSSIDLILDRVVRSLHLYEEFMAFAWKKLQERREERRKEQLSDVDHE